jgi:hypothetical protein
VLFGAQKYLFNRNSEPSAQTPAQTADNSVTKPSPVGQSQTPDDTAKQAPGPQAPPEATAPENATPAPPEGRASRTPANHQEDDAQPTRPQAERPTTTPAIEPKPGVGQSVQFLTEPPGAQVTVDGTVEGKKTPAVFNLAPGMYHVKVARSGAFIDFDVQIRDGEFINKRVDF